MNLGEKTFTLFPPSDIVFLPEKGVRTCRYHFKNERKTDLNNSESSSRISKDDIEIDTSTISKGDFSYYVNHIQVSRTYIPNIEANCRLSSRFESI